MLIPARHGNAVFKTYFAAVAIRRIGDAREWVTMLSALQATARWIIHSQSGTEPTPTTDEKLRLH